MNRKRARLIIRSVIVLIISGLLIGFFYTTLWIQIIQINRIKNDIKIAQEGRISKITRLPKYNNTCIVDFNFFVNGRVIEDERKYAWKLFSRISFKNRRFPVAYEKQNPSNAYLLITPDDFKRFDMTFPDSLSWVIKELKGADD